MFFHIIFMIEIVTLIHCLWDEHLVNDYNL